MIHGFFGRICWSLAILSLFAGTALTQENFSRLVGPVNVAAVKNTKPLEVPFIIWGGDVATFRANGGLETKSGSHYNKHGLDLKLVPGDDFVGQVKRYMEGKTPFLRGTMRMIGQASEVIGSHPDTKPVVFLQLTWSAGDHMVSREEVKTLNDLKGKKIVLQQGGPHVGMLDDILRSANLSWGDVTVVWAKDLTGPDGPAEIFSKDQSIDCCMVISPDMIALTGGLDLKGTGAEGTIKGAKVLISTATMSRSIADVYVCRRDFYQANQPLIEKFVAGYLKATEELVELKKQFDKTGNAPDYMKTLKLAQDIYGTDVLPTLEIDAHGLVSDASFVGLPGNSNFFENKGNLNGFSAKTNAALDLAVEQGYAKVRAGFLPPNLSYSKIKSLGDLQGEINPVIGETSAGGFESLEDIQGDEDTILSFTINFQPNQTDFSEDVYGPEFLRAVQSASTYGRAVVQIRGHSDPTKTLVDMIKAGMQKGSIKRTGTRGNYKYYLNGKPLDLTATEQMAAEIEKGSFDGTQPNPRATMQAALNLSQARAEAVRDAIIGFAKGNGYQLDPTQIQPSGVGVTEPVIAKPTNLAQAKQNMRVEFRLIKPPAEVIKSSDFDF